MNKLPWKLVNAENVEAFVCDETYSSKMLTGDEMAGQQVININEGTLQPHCRTEGGAHDENGALLHRFSQVRYLCLAR